MANLFQDNDDLSYYVDRGIDWQPLVELLEHGFASQDGFKTTAEAVQAYREVLELVGGFVAEQVVPFTAEIEKQGLGFERGEVRVPPRLASIFEQMKEMQLHGMSQPRELGGMNCPMLVHFLAYDIIARGDASVLAHFGFHGAIASTMLLYSLNEGTTELDEHTGAIVKTRFQAEIEEIIRGEAWGSMDITEANAGSDMAALKARAEQDEHGQWLLSGEKIFITSGHGKYHFVIARTEPETQESGGLKGLSLFLVRAYEDTAAGRKRYAQVERIEEKMGHHASPTCVVTFDRAPAELVGRRGEGFGLMLLLMNGARIGVGFEALGLCEAAYRAAKAYAAERKSMGKTIDKHELIADYLDEMRTDIQGIRALTVHAGYHEEMAERLEAKLKYVGDPTSDEAKALKRRLRRHRREARNATPLVKYVAAEKAVEIARRAIQIHGGIGYTTELGVERLLRDALAMPIYEGTSQIQALMAMKDTLGAIMANPQEFVRRLAQARWRSLSARDGLERRVAKLQSQVLGVEQHLLSKTATEKLKALAHEPITTWPKAFFRQWDPKRDFAYALLHAERLTVLLADAAIAEVLFEQAQRHPERREVLERWLERAEPRDRFLADTISTTGDRLLAQLAGAEELEATKTA